MEDVPSENGQVARGFFFRRLLAYVFDPNARMGLLSWINDTVTAHVLPRHGLHSEHAGAPARLVRLHQLPQAWHLRIDYIIAEKDGKRFVAYKFASTPDGMAKPQCLFLPNIVDIH